MPTITGTTGNDVLTGNAEADVINGLDGDDVIDGGGGPDELSGGAGADTFIFSNVSNTSAQPLGRIDGGSGYDTLDLTRVGAIQIVNGRLQAGTQFYDVVNVERVLLSDAGNRLSFGTSAGLEIIGGAGADIISGGTGVDRLYGIGGDDTLTAGAGDLADGGAGNDTLVGVDQSELFGGAGNDFLTGRGGTRMYGGDGDDTFTIGFASNVAGTRDGVIEGGAGVDVLTVSTDDVANVAFNAVVDLAAGTVTRGNIRYAVSGLKTSPWTVPTESVRRFWGMMAQTSCARSGQPETRLAPLEPAS